MSNAITLQLDAARAELVEIDRNLAELGRKRDIVAAKVEAFELSAQYIEGMQAKTKKPASKRPRTPSKDWRQIFSALKAGQTFGYDEILDVAMMLGIENVKRPSLRTKMMNYANDGYVERVDNGRFRITEAGIAYFNIDKDSPNQEAPSNRTKGASYPERGGSKVQEQGFPSVSPEGSSPSTSTAEPPSSDESEELEDLDDEVPF